MPIQKIDPEEVRFFSGSSNPQLARAIADHLGVPLEPTRIKRFGNDCLSIQLGASVRSRRVFIVHAPRISITARLVADLLQASGATHVMTMVLHSPQVHGFFGVPTDPLTSRPVFKHYFESRDLASTIVVAPDLGHANSAARFARDLGVPMTAGNKTRISDTKVQINSIVGQQVRGFKRALIFDDEVSTGGSVVELSRILIEQEVEEIWVVCTHGVFVKGGLEKIAAIPQITTIVTTDTVYQPPEKRNSKLQILSVAPVFGEAIYRNYSRQSISDLFAFWEDGS